MHPVLGGPSQSLFHFFLPLWDHQEGARHRPGTSTVGSEEEWVLQHKVKTSEDRGLDV